jgi:transposase
LLPLELLAAPEGSCLVRACLDVENLTIHLATTAPGAACPLCGYDTRRVHSRYTRRLDDLPCLGRCVRLQFAVRRFVCPLLDCPRHIFVERLPGFAAPWARTTDRLCQTQADIGSSLGGEAGSRLAARMAITTSPDTLLRRVKLLKSEPAEPPRVVGIDDWAWRKGQRYGTIVVDLERSEVIDLLPDRDADTAAAWLKAHPGVEVVSRDRSAAYAQAATEGASQAVQVADRWHLLKNLREAVERVLERHSAIVGAAVKAIETPTETRPDAAAAPETGAAASPVEPSPPQPPSEPCPDSPQTRAEQSKRQKRIDRFEQVRDLRGRGFSAARIAWELGLSRRSVFRYLRRATCPAWGLGGSRRSRLDGHREWIDARLAEGFMNVAELHRRLTERGFKGSYGSVYEFVTKRLGAAGKQRERLNAAKPPIPAPPSARQLSFEWIRRVEKRKPPEQARLDAIRAQSDELAATLDLADGFANLIRKRSRETLSEWLTQGEASSDPDLRRFAEGIRRDEAAVHAAVTETWSNGPVEGHVNRLKTIKRQMYGRAGFMLLRARVLKAA